MTTFHYLLLLYVAKVIAAPLNESITCSSAEDARDISHKVGKSFSGLEVSIVAIVLTTSVRQNIAKYLSEPHYWWLAFILFLMSGMVNSWGLFIVLKVLASFSEFGQFTLVHLCINYMLLMPFCVYTCVVGYLNTALSNSEIYKVPFYALCEVVVFLGQNDIPAAKLISTKYGNEIKELSKGYKITLEGCTLESFFYRYKQPNETEVEHPQASAVCVRKHRLRKYYSKTEASAFLQGFTFRDPVVLGHHPFTSWLDRTTLCPKKKYYNTQ